MKKIFSFLCVFLSLHSHAEVIRDDQVWLNLNTFIKLNENWQIYGEYQPRFFDYARYSAVTLHRAAIGRNLKHGLSAWAGYGFMTWNDRKDSKFPAKNQHEDRPFLMLMHNHDIGSWKITNRTRYEHRMFRYDDEASKRLRHLLRVQYKIGESQWAIAAWNEYFWNTNTIKPSKQSHGPVTPSGFDQNRAFLGVAYFFGEKNHMLETGYMNNYVNGATKDRNADVWMTTVTARF